MTLGLGDGDVGSPFWPEPFRAIYTVTFARTLSCASPCKTARRTRSPSKRRCTHFAVSDITAIAISGLAGTTYIDKTEAARREQQTAALVTITAETDRVYLDTPGRCVIEDRGWRRRVVIEKVGAASSVVGNPWAEKAAAMVDLGDPAWRGMVASRPGISPTTRCGSPQMANTYPDATRLLITADGGGSNGSRVRLWKRELQKLANKLGLDIVVSHLPPGTSKWNKIEHRLFSFISQNWRAKPLVSYRVIVELISATTTKTGLTVRCELDTGQYPSGIVVSEAEMAAINIKRAEFHGEWNYTISPNIHPPNDALIS